MLILDFTWPIVVGLKLINSPSSGYPLLLPDDAYMSYMHNFWYMVHFPFELTQKAANTPFCYKFDLKLLLFFLPKKLSY